MLDQAFWSDPDVEAQKPGVKLAAIWLITNSRTSQLGICGASPQRFEFETGLPAKALNAAIEALPRSFRRFGDVIFVRNYIRHQFGIGEKLTKNNFFVGLKSLFLAVRDKALSAFILEEYPEFSLALPVVQKGEGDHTVAAGLRLQILARDEFVCLYTGEQLSEEDLEADHVVPLSKGGKTVPENLMAASEKMNTLKNNKDLEVFCKEQGFDFLRISETIKTRALKPLPGLPKPKLRTGKERKGVFEPDENAQRIAELFNRRPSTVWDEKETKAYLTLGPIDPDDLRAVEVYTKAERAKGDDGIHRRDLVTFLNNFRTEVDRARNAKGKPATSKSGEWADSRPKSPAVSPEEAERIAQKAKEAAAQFRKEQGAE